MQRDRAYAYACAGIVVDILWTKPTKSFTLTTLSDLLTIILMRILHDCRTQIFRTSETSS